VTDAPEETVIKRLAARSGWSEQQARARIASQLPRAERLSHAQVVIDTSGSLADVRKQVKLRWQERIGRLE
jgi:dephospho-CoA kinase